MEQHTSLNISQVVIADVSGHDAVPCAAANHFVRVRCQVTECAVAMWTDGGVQESGTTLRSDMHGTASQPNSGVRISVFGVMSRHL